MREDKARVIDLRVFFSLSLIYRRAHTMALVHNVWIFFFFLSWGLLRTYVRT